MHYRNLSISSESREIDVKTSKGGERKKKSDQSNIRQKMRDKERKKERESIVSTEYKIRW